MFATGYIFIDYLANTIALAQGQTTENPPRFYRRLDLSADIRDTIFTSTSENGSITNRIRSELF